MDSLKLKLKKWIGSWFGYWCPVCGSPVEDIGYNFKTRCTDPDCLSRKEAAERFDIPKDIVKKKRGRPKKIS